MDTTPSDALRTAEERLAGATPERLDLARDLYMAYCSETGHRSAVTGAPLPPFAECNPLVRAAWLATADHVLLRFAPRDPGARTLREQARDGDRRPG